MKRSRRKEFTVVGEKNRILTPGLWIAIVKRPQTLLELMGTRETDRQTQAI